MAFFKFMVKSSRLEKSKNFYFQEKINSISIKEVKKTHHNFLQKIKIYHLMYKLQKSVSNLAILLSFVISIISSNGTFENKIFKSIVGFLSGILLTFTFLCFLVYSKFTLSSATFFCSLSGIVLTISLAFSYRIRCITLLLFFQCFSKRGRQALIAYAFVLMLVGPTSNTLHNVQVLSELLSCGQEELKQMIETFTNLTIQPYLAFQHSIMQIVKVISNVMDNIKNILYTINQCFLSLYSVIKSVYDWLISIVNLCNKKFGTPYEKCQNVFNIAIADCKAKLGPIFKPFCEIANTAQNLCYTIKPLDFVCLLTSLIKNMILDTVQKSMNSILFVIVAFYYFNNIKSFMYQLRTMFYVKINFSHFLNFETHKNNQYHNIVIYILKDIKSQISRFLVVFNSMSFVTSFFFLCVLLRVINYRYKWLTKDSFDNKYLTNHFYDIDLIRRRKRKEIVLPLSRREKKKYIKLLSTRLITQEKIQMAKSTIFLGIVTIKFCINLFVDHSLFWILSTINYYGRFSMKTLQSNIIGFHIVGNKYIADIYRNISKIFLRFQNDNRNSTFLCLSDPSSPNYNQYITIAIIISFCWLLALFEPYGRRFSQTVMSYYYPERARHRTVWLYNHILR
ncbi:GSCOCG00011669001-RA-CDS [Cotesia congregata]|nr:GSCOCG00011669001-RA-CDS [Cotesia congregata]